MRSPGKKNTLLPPSSSSPSSPDSSLPFPPPSPACLHGHAASLLAARARLSLPLLPEPISARALRPPRQRARPPRAHLTMVRCASVSSPGGAEGSSRVWSSGPKLEPAACSGAAGSGAAGSGSGPGALMAAPPPPPSAAAPQPRTPPALRWRRARARRRAGFDQWERGAEIPAPRGGPAPRC